MKEKITYHFSDQAHPALRENKLQVVNVQDEDPVSIINEISFEPVNSNDTDEEEDDEGCYQKSKQSFT